MSEVELIRQGLKMYGPGEGKVVPSDPWYGIYFNHVPMLVAEIDTLTARVAALEDALRQVRSNMVGITYGQFDHEYPCKSCLEKAKIAAAILAPQGGYQ